MFTAGKIRDMKSRLFQWGILSIKNRKLNNREFKLFQIQDKETTVGLHGQYKENYDSL